MADIVVEGRDLTRDYITRGGMFSGAKVTHALKGVSFAVERGTTLAVVGESGCGKSTLARIVTLIDPATSGTLLIEGEPVELLEPYFFDFDGDLYGRRIEVEFVAKLRDEEKFPDLPALVVQMDRDAAEARRILRQAMPSQPSQPNTTEQASA